MQNLPVMVCSYNLVDMIKSQDNASIKRFPLPGMKISFDDLLFLIINQLKYEKTSYRNFIRLDFRNYEQLEKSKTIDENYPEQLKEEFKNNSETLQPESDDFIVSVESLLKIFKPGSDLKMDNAIKTNRESREDNLFVGIEDVDISSAIIEKITEKLINMQLSDDINKTDIIKNVLLSGSYYKGERITIHDEISAFYPEKLQFQETKASTPLASPIFEDSYVDEGIQLSRPAIILSFTEEKNPLNIFNQKDKYDYQKQVIFDEVLFIGTEEEKNLRGNLMKETREIPAPSLKESIQEIKFNTKTATDDDKTLLSNQWNLIKNFKGSNQDDRKISHLPSSNISQLQGKIIESIIHSVRFGMDKGYARIDLRLKPEVFGEVKITLMVRENNLNAEITTSSSFTKEIIEGGIQFLRDALTEHGLRIDKFSVILNERGLTGNFLNSQGYHNGSDSFSEIRNNNFISHESSCENISEDPVLTLKVDSIVNIIA